MMRTNEDGKKPNKSGKSGGRDARLAAALRENLRRRKEQERGRDASPQPGAGSQSGRLLQGDKNR
jgi:hypothetical protein